MGAEPAQGSHERDAAHLLALLQSLSTQTCPDVAHTEQVAAREAQRAWERAQEPPPAAPEVREAHLAAIRAGLKGVPQRRAPREPRTRPPCSLCAGEGAYFVTRDVHLCKRCVDVLATGQARLSEVG